MEKIFLALEKIFLVYGKNLSRFRKKLSRLITSKFLSTKKKLVFYTVHKIMSLSLCKVYNFAIAKLPITFSYKSFFPILKIQKSEKICLVLEKIFLAEKICLVLEKIFLVYGKNLSRS